MAKKRDNNYVQSGEPQDVKRSKKQRNGRVIRVATIAIIMGLMASAIAGLGVALHYSTEQVQTHESYQRQMDAVYFRAYYDLIDGANDLGISLKKLGMSGSPSMQQSLLYEVWSAAELSEANLGIFETDGEGINKAQKFVNQLGDYAHSLALRVANGDPLTVAEREKLVKMARVADAYLRALQQIQEDVDNGKLFVGDDGALKGVQDAFSQFAEPSFDYPEMIYDGPFSDALEDRSPVALVGEEIDEEEGQHALMAYFDGMRVENVEFAGEGEGYIKTLNYSFTLDGRPAFAQLVKNGGGLLSFNTAQGERDLMTASSASKTCQRAALDFASKLGFDNMQVVWSSSAQGECVVNLAPVQDGVVLYPDLVKVKLDEATSSPVGFDATHYALNHRRRDISSPAISAEQAATALSMPAIGDGRLALIPLRGSREVLSYEFECHSDGVYFVYIDAFSREEVNILYVLDDRTV